MRARIAPQADIIWMKDATGFIHNRQHRTICGGRRRSCLAQIRRLTGNWCFITAGISIFVIGLVHSILGERFIFRRMRSTRFIPTNGGQVLREPHVRILWASWHVVTMMGWCIAIFLFWLALPSSKDLESSLPVQAAAISMLASSMLVFIGTRGKHLGWLGLLVAAIFTTIGQYV